MSRPTTITIHTDLDRVDIVVKDLAAANKTRNRILFWTGAMATPTVFCLLVLFGAWVLAAVNPLSNLALTVALIIPVAVQLVLMAAGVPILVRLVRTSRHKRLAFTPHKLLTERWAFALDEIVEAQIEDGAIVVIGNGWTRRILDGLQADQLRWLRDRIAVTARERRLALQAGGVDVDRPVRVPEKLVQMLAKPQ